MSNLGTHRNGNLHSPHREVLQHTGILDDDDQLREEMRRLAAVNAELLGGIATATEEPPAETGELEQLRAENLELRTKLDELDQAWTERQREYENLLEEKTEVIRGLHQKLQEQVEAAGSKPPKETPKEDELRRLKTELEEARRQLVEDEESLTTQMRQMEMALSRDRAELARQRSDMQRLKTELDREIENTSRDSGLRERLLGLRRPGSSPALTPPPENQPTPSTDTPASKKSSGLLRRLFG